MFRPQAVLALAAICFLLNGCAQHHETKCSPTAEKKACCAAPSKTSKLTH